MESHMPVTQISEIPIGKLHPHPANVHKHSKKQIAQIAESIHRFGFTAPIIADENGNILAGHGRWFAAQKLGLSHVPVVVVSGLSDAERRAYLLADNKLTENAGWDRRGLAKELKELGPLLSEAGLDIGLTGFETPEIDTLMGVLVETEKGSVDYSGDIAKELVSRTGDVWMLDGHRIGCGDAKNDGDWRLVMGGEPAAMVFADPLVNARVKIAQGRHAPQARERARSSGELNPEDLISFLVDTLSLAIKFSDPGSIHYVCSHWRHLQELLLAGNKLYGVPLDLVVWHKTNAEQGSLYRSQHELILVFKNGETSPIGNIKIGRHGRNRSNVWSYAGINSFHAGQLGEIPPAVKPVALVADAMRDCSRQGDIVFDPFVGSGTTILAAERVGRRGYGLEIDPHHVDAAVRRWRAFTKREALLLCTGQTFSEMTAIRRRRVM
jgi:hypothetical protein